MQKSVNKSTGVKRFFIVTRQNQIIVFLEEREKVELALACCCIQTEPYICLA
jgi:hypothetical protein